MPNEAAPPTSCRLCAAPTAHCGQQRLLGHDVSMYRCARCDLIQTEPPYWLDEAYSEAISALDTGALQRNQVAVGVTLALARLVGVARSAPCLDWGGGHGVFVRMMRDRGYDFRWRDQYAENVYARGFEGALDTPYELVTSFEVLEHLVDVRAELGRMFATSPRFMLVATRLHEGYREDWWYYAHETGQHVAFYSAATLRFVAAEFGYEVAIGSAFSCFYRRDQLGAARRAALGALMRHAFWGFALSSVFPDAVRLALPASRTQRDYDLLAAVRRERSTISVSGSTPESAATKPQTAT